MKVISKINTKKLVKGCEYKATSYKNSGLNRWGEGTISILSMGSYSIKNFTDTNGDPLPQKDWSSPTVVREILKQSDVKVGDLLVSICDTKILNKNSIYKISEVIYSDKTYMGKVKVLGSTNKYRLYNFRKLDQSELVDININNIFGENVEYKATKERKIDIIENKDSILMKLLSKAIIDTNRNNLTVVEWAVKIDNRFSTTLEDYNHLLDMKLSDIINYALDKD